MKIRGFSVLVHPDGEVTKRELTVYTIDPEDVKGANEVIPLTQGIKAWYGLIPPGRGLNETSNPLIVEFWKSKSVAKRDLVQSLTLGCEVLFCTRHWLEPDYFTFDNGSKIPVSGQIQVLGDSFQLLHSKGAIDLMAGDLDGQVRGMLEYLARRRT